MSGRNSRDNRRRALDEARQAQQRRKRRLRLAAWAGAVVVVAGAGLGVGLGLSGSGGSSGPVAGAGSTASYGPLSSLGTLTAAPAPGSLGPENVPIPSVPELAGTSAATAGQAIDGIGCQTSEQTVFHIHTHLTIFVNGQQRQVPAAIGIPNPKAAQSRGGVFVGSGKCYYWLHTHSADGIIHIESPVQRTFNLGEFFDIWGQPLGPDQVGPAHGRVTVFVNGQWSQGNPRNVQLGSHEDLTVEVGAPLVSPPQTDWSITGL